MYRRRATGIIEDDDDFRVRSSAGSPVLVPDRPSSNSLGRVKTYL